ncbi:hypothetical protein HNY73_007522 [Argiope bruennichi]|uniref:Uncharacterized protein n=1 Tax=Argiope bruennichi TaxID=94029 RepID=A0A8T0FGR7_ARGBR|nr:hypothetical protein HNY73_007522 [Argiope bruennichi]
MKTSEKLSMLSNSRRPGRIQTENLSSPVWQKGEWVRMPAGRKDGGGGSPLKYQISQEAIKMTDFMVLCLMPPFILMYRKTSQLITQKRDTNNVLQVMFHEVMKNGTPRHQTKSFTMGFSSFHELYDGILTRLHIGHAQNTLFAKYPSA